MKKISCPSLTDLGYEFNLLTVSEQVDTQYDVQAIVIAVYEQLRSPIFGRFVR